MNMRRFGIYPVVVPGVAHSPGDVIFDTVEVQEALQSYKMDGLLRCVTLRNFDGTSLDLMLLFFDDSYSLGVATNPSDPTEAALKGITGIVVTPKESFVTVGDYSLATLHSLEIPLDSVKNSGSIWVAGITNKAVTFSRPDSLHICLWCEEH